MNIRDIIKEIAGDQAERNLFATVISVNTPNKTCEVKTIADQMRVFDVRLISNNGNGVLFIPSVNSVVGVCMINEVEGFVSLYSQIDSIQYGDGSFNGMIKVDDLVTRLNTIEQDINDLKTALSGWTPVPSDGGAALKTALASYYSSSLTETVRADLENDKITHGDF